MKTKLTSIICLSILLLSLNSCLTKKGVIHDFNYPKQQNTFTLNFSNEYVWDKVIDFFASNNLKIEIIETSSGLICSSKTNFPATYWFADTQSLGDANSFIAVQYCSDYKKDGTGIKALASWNVRIKKMSDNKTEISINIESPVIMANTYMGNGQTQFLETILQSRSTGVFEKYLIDYICK